jgi:hypothetical protein
MNYSFNFATPKYAKTPTPTTSNAKRYTPNINNNANSCNLMNQSFNTIVRTTPNALNYQCIAMNKEFLFDNVNKYALLTMLKKNKVSKSNIQQYYRNRMRRESQQQMNIIKPVLIFIQQQLRSINGSTQSDMAEYNKLTQLRTQLLNSLSENTVPLPFLEMI